MTRAAARLVEAAYRWTPDEDEWLRGVVDAASSFEVGGGVVGYTVNLRGAPEVASLCTGDGASPEVGAALQRLTKAFGPSLARAMYAPTELAGNAAWRLERVAPSFDTTRREVEGRAGAALPPMWAVVGGDPRARSLVVAFPSRAVIAPDEPFPRSDGARQLGLLGAHLGSALRLRGAIGPVTADDPGTDAVLSPDGDVLHATGVAKSRRRSLAAAVKRSERARLRGVPDEEALALWRALVDGRWTIVDIEERDGKRLLLARRNALGAADVAALDDLERDVAWLASMGHSFKYIAYELGVSMPIVVRRLTSALSKLGIQSRRDLVRIFARG